MKDKKMTIKSNKILFGSRSNINNNKNNGTDFYPTPKWSIKELLKYEKIIEPVLEPCNGLGNITNTLKENNILDITTFDINKNAIADKYLNFLQYKKKNEFNTIITNPPFKENNNAEFIKKALEILSKNGKAIFLLKLVFLESQKRKKFFNKNPPKRILVHSKRLNFYGGTGICYAWFIWEKENKEKTIIEII